MREYGFIPVNLSVDAFCIRIEEKIGWIASESCVRRPWSMDPESVSLPGSDTREITMPAMRSQFRKVVPVFKSIVIEKAKFHTLGNAGKQ